jgi:hypothetical protein
MVKRQWRSEEKGLGEETEGKTEKGEENYS